MSPSEELTALGPFFAVEFHGSATPDGAWRPMAELVDEPRVLAERVTAVQAFLAAGTGQNADTVELRVAASVVHLGLTARVVAPLFAMSLLYGRILAVSLRDLRWQPTLGGMFPLSMPSEGLASGAGLLDGAVAELSSLMTRFGVNEHILRGNIASAFGGAAKTFAAARPEWAAASRAALSDFLKAPALESSAHLEPDGALRRHSCCLIYRAAPNHDGALCGDCALGTVRGSDHVVEVRSFSHMIEPRRWSPAS